MGAKTGRRRLWALVQKQQETIDLQRDEIRQLQEQIHVVEENSYYARQAAEDMIASERRRSREAEYRAEETQRECEDRRYEREQITRDLERARSSGDDWGTERALRKLKSL